MDIIVDPRFRDKIPKPSEEERRRLEENILADGIVREPLVLWKGTNILVDGHNRWDIIQKHPEIPYSTIEQEFRNEWDVIAWICRNQLGRRNISKVVYDKLLQEEYEAIQKIVPNPFGANQFTNKEVGGENPHQPNKEPKTRKILAEEHGITEQAVRSAVEFGRGLEAADEIVPGFKDEILSGETKAAKQDIAEMRKMGPEEIVATVEKIRNPQRITFPSGNQYKAKNKTKEEEEIERTAAKKTNKAAVVEYGIEDLLEELKMLQNDFVDKYHNVIDLHMDVATDNGKKVLAVMREFENEWKILKERVK